MGLGLLGRGLGDAIFLAECGADLIVTDLKSEKELELSLKKLRRFKNVRYTLGRHDVTDFHGRDFILKAAGVPLDSPFIAEARKNNIPVEMDASLFIKLAPPINFVGITGTRGKTTTTLIIFEILKAAGKKVYLGGNIKDAATLPLLARVKKGDYVVAELDSWQLQGFHDSKISPNVAVFTTFFDDHLIYYKGDSEMYFRDKEAIFRYQKAKNVLVVGEQTTARVLKARPPVVPIIARASDVLSDWKLKIIGEHNRANAACAIAATRALGISDAVIKKAVLNFKGVPGRLELIPTFQGVKIYNDTTATTPEATIAALRALRELGKEKKLILILGGSDKGLDMSKLVEEIPKLCKAVFLLPGTGTEKLRITNHESKIMIKHQDTLKKCVEESIKIAKKGDVILFSPAFASFGMFKNEYDRGEQFMKIVLNLEG